MYEGYLQLGGTEIANANRVADYVRNNLPGFPLKNCIECDQLRESLGDPLYESPMVDDAPWVDVSNPATFDFYGFYPLEVTGVGGSTRSASVTESINSGGWVGQVRYGSREIRVKGILVARNGLALDAGLTWLKMALDPSVCADHGGSCGGATMCYYTACPTFDLTCFRPVAVDGPITPITSITAATSPTLFNLPSDPGAYKAFFRVNPSDGLVFNWGRRKLLNQDIIEQFGPAVSQRTNWILNPSFSTSLTGWTANTVTFTRQPTGGVDDGGYGQVTFPNLATNSSFETVTAGSTVFRRNLFPTPYGLWTTNSAVNWPIVADTTVVRRPGTTSTRSSTSAAASGAQGGFIASMSAIGVPNGSAVNAGPQVTPGTVYTISAYWRANFPNARPGFYYEWFNASSVSLGATAASPLPVSTTHPADTWVRFSFALPVAPPSAKYLRIGMFVRQANQVPTTAADVVWVQDALLEAATTVNEYFDGGVPDADGFDHGWAGTVLASESTAKAAGTTVRTNHAINPAMNNSITGWTVPSGLGLTQTPETGGTRIDGASPIGSDAGIFYVTDAAIPGPAGSLWSAAIDVTVPTGFPAAGFYLAIWSYGQEAMLSISQAFTPIQPGETRRLATTAEVARTTAASTGVRMILYAAAALPAGFRIKVSRAILERGVLPPGPYFDGGTPVGDGAGYAWTGAADASTSTMLRPAVAGASVPVGQGVVWQDTNLPLDLLRFARYRVDSTGDVELNLTDTPGIASGVPRTATMQIRVQSLATITIQPRWRNAAGVFENAGASIQVAPSTEWVTISRAGTPAIADAQLSLFLPTGGGHSLGDLVDIDTHAVYAPQAGYLRTTGALGVGLGAVTGSFYLRGDGTTVTVQLRSDVTDGVLASQTITLSSSWQQFSIESSFAQDSYLRFSGNGPFDVDQVLVENASMLLPYFDGSSDADLVMAAFRPKGTSYTGSWVGAVNASPSRVVWSGQQMVGGMQQFGFDEICDPLWRPYLDVISGEIRDGQFGYTVRDTVPIDEQTEVYERHYHDVTAIEGPNIIEKYTESRLGGAAYVVDFTLVAATPFAYSRTREIVPLPGSPSPHNHLGSQLWPEITCAESVAGPILDPDCPSPPSPPAPPSIENPCIDYPAVWRRTWLEIPAEEVSAWSQMLPTVVMSTESQEVRQVRVRFYPNPFNFNGEAGAYRENRATNPSLYLDSSGWLSVGSTSVTRVATGGPENRAHWEVTATAAHAAQGFGVYVGGAGTPTLNPVTPGEEVFLSLGVRASTARQVQLRYEFWSAGNTQVGATVYGQVTSLAANTWTRVAIPTRVTVPAGAVRMGLGVVNATTAATIGEKLSASMAEIELATNPTSTPSPYFDGNSIDAAGVYYGWSGAISASPSVASYSPIDPCSFCSEFVVSYLPAYSNVTIDGMVRRAYATIQGGPSRPASNLLYAGDGGPMSWSELTCGIPYLVSVDVPPDQWENVEFGIALTRKE